MLTSPHNKTTVSALQETSFSKSFNLYNILCNDKSETPYNDNYIMCEYGDKSDDIKDNGRPNDQRPNIELGQIVPFYVEIT